MSAGTQKIDQLDTPFLYLFQDGGEAVAIHPAYLKTHVPAAEQTGPSRPHEMQVEELQHALGLVETDKDGCASFPRPKWMLAPGERSEDFGAQRKVCALLALT